MKPLIVSMYESAINEVEERGVKSGKKTKVRGRVVDIYFIQHKGTNTDFIRHYGKETPRESDTDIGDWIAYTDLDGNPETMWWGWGKTKEEAIKRLNDDIDYFQGR